MAITQRGDARVIEHSITLNASPDEVFKAIGDVDAMSTWFTSRASGAARVGGKYQFEFEFEDTSRNHTMLGEFTALDSGEKVGYTWSTVPAEGSETEAPVTLVEYAISGSGGQTRVDLVHSGFGSDAPEQLISETDQGWGFFLPNLKSVLDDGADARAGAMGQIIA